MRPRAGGDSYDNGAELGVSVLPNASDNPIQKKQAEVANFALATTVDALKRGGIPVKLRFDGEPSTSIKGSWMTHAATARAGPI